MPCFTARMADVKGLKNKAVCIDLIHADLEERWKDSVHVIETKIIFFERWVWFNLILSHSTLNTAKTNTTFKARGTPSMSSSFFNEKTTLKSFSWGHSKNLQSVYELW